MRGVSAVGVGAVTAQAKYAVAIATRDIGLRGKAGGAIDVGDGHHAAGGEHRIGFG